VSAVANKQQQNEEPACEVAGFLLSLAGIQANKKTGAAYP